MKTFHGGAFYELIGEDFARLDMLEDGSVINADVLDAWFRPSPRALERVRRFLPNLLGTSPPTHAQGLKKAIAESRGLPGNSILVGGGSSDLMFVLFPSILKQGDDVLILDPTYGEYEYIFSEIIKTKIHRFSLKKQDNFIVNVDKLTQTINAINPKVVVLVNPNSPTGQFIPKQELLCIVKNVSPNTLFVFDETYVEYVGVKNSMEQEVPEHQNLIVLKSMSKVYALSGARVAYMVVPVHLTKTLNMIIPPWSVSGIGQLAAIEALADAQYYQEKYAITHELREEFFATLRSLPDIKVYDSCASFFMIELCNKKVTASGIVDLLKKQGIFVRNCDSMSKQFDNNFIRVAVKNRKQNAKIVNEFKYALQKMAE